MRARRVAPRHMERKCQQSCQQQIQSVSLCKPRRCEIIGQRATRVTQLLGLLSFLSLEAEYGMRYCILQPSCLL